MKWVKITFLLLCLLVSINSWEMEIVPCDDPNCVPDSCNGTTCTKCQDGYYINDTASVCATC